MALVFNDIQGVESSTFSYGGPAFLDVEGYFLDNIFGDKADVATSFAGSSVIGVGFAGTIGQGTIAVTSAAGFVGGQYAQIGIGANAEIVGTITISGTILSFPNTPLRFPHLAGAPVQSVVGTSGPFTHTWNILNNSSGQPPTHTFTDFTNLTANVGARAYTGACVGVVDITGNSEQLLEMKMTGDAWVSAPATQTPVNVVSTAIPVPNWRSTVTVGGTQVFSVGEWSVSIKRTLQIYWTDQGTTQNPYIIARGPLDATGTLNYTVPTDESPLLNMLNNTQGSLSINIGNGISGAGTLGMTIACGSTAFEKSKPSRSEVLIGYQNDWQAVANSSNSGGSGGLGPLTVTVVNNIPTY
jgi:hypothetical protein